MNGYIVALIVIVVILIIALGRYVSMFNNLALAIEDSPTGCKEYIKKKLQSN
jgi:hypothetical protein